MARLPGFIGPAYTSQSKIAAADELVNLYVEKIESGTGKAPYVAYSAPGFRQWCDLGTASPVRGQFALNGAGFAVAGASVYDVPAIRGGAPTTRATGLANPDDSLVSIAGNGDGGYQLVIAGAGHLYCLDLQTNALTEIPGVAASFVIFIDGTFYALDPSTSNLYASAPNDGSTWDLADVLQRSDQADKWLTLLLKNGEVWLPGSKSGSVYYDNGGDGDFPLAANPSGKLSTGILAPQSAAIVVGDPMWLGQDAAGGAVVVRAQGFGLQRVSTHALEYALSTYATVADADAFSYQDRGHAFYVLNFPSAGVSWAYDATNGQWHKRGPQTSTGFDVLPVRTHMYANGTHLMGGREDGVIWEMRGDLSTDLDGSGLVRLRRAPHLADENVRIVYDRLTLDMETGVGLATGDGSDPQMMLRWSDDGGQTWSNVVPAPIGAIGAYTSRVEWWQLGQARDRIFEVSCADPVPISLIDCYIQMRRGRS